MYISDFKYFRPKTIKEAISILESSSDAALIAGGTDLLVEIKKGLRQHDDIVSLKDIDELRTITESDERIYIGAGVTHNELISSELIREKIPAIAQAASKIGCEQVRNAGTIGGNLCTAASCCDLGPVLMTLDALVEITSSKNTKTILLKDFFIFHRKTVLLKGEIVTRIIVPIPDPRSGYHFEKFGLREAAAVSVASVAIMVRMDRNGICKDASIVIGAVAPTPTISYQSADQIKGKDLVRLSHSSPILDLAGKAAAEDAIPIDDIRGGAKYRRDILKVLTGRAILKAVAKAQKNQ